MGWRLVASIVVGGVEPQDCVLLPAVGLGSSGSFNYTCLMMSAFPMLVEIQEINN